MYEFLTIILAIISILLTIYIIHQSRKAKEFQEDVAISQGVFKTRNIEINALSQKEINSFLISVPLEQKRILTVPFLVDIRNSGEKSCEEVEIFFRANKSLFFGGGAHYFTDPKFPKNITSHGHESGSMFSITFSVNVIHPKQPILLSLPLSLYGPTILKRQVSATTLNGVDIVATAWIGIAIILDCVVVQKDEEPVTKRFDLRIINSRKDEIRQFMFEYNKAFSKKYEKKTSGVSFFRWIFKTFKSRTTGKEPIGDVGIMVVDDTKLERVRLKGEGSKLNIYHAPEESIKIYRGTEFPNGFLFTDLGIYPITDKVSDSKHKKKEKK